MIDGLNGIQGINSQIQDLKPLASMSDNRQIQFPKAKQEDKLLAAHLNESKLDERVPNKAALNKLGFNVPFSAKKIGNMEFPEQPFLLDMNEGKTYQNKNGDTIRICEFDGALESGMKGATSVEYKSKDGGMAHKVLYDPEGNPMKGSLTVTNKDGSIEQFEYEYDLDGNKHVTSYQKAVRG